MWMKRTHPQVICVEPIYLLCSPYGHITVQEEYFCWLFASGESYRASCRMAYGTKTQVSWNTKLLERVKDLKEMDALGEIDLVSGPWYYYKIDIGNPNARNTKDIVDYRELCQTKSSQKKN